MCCKPVNVCNAKYYKHIEIAIKGNSNRHLCHSGVGGPHEKGPVTPHLVQDHRAFEAI
jgi:hypothetical protein